MITVTFFLNTETYDSWLEYNRPLNNYLYFCLVKISVEYWKILQLSETNLLVWRIIRKENRKNYTS